MGPGTRCKETNISKGNITLEENLDLKNPSKSIKIKCRALNVLTTNMVIM